MAKFEPKVGQYHYECHKKHHSCLVYIVYLRKSEGCDEKIKEFDFSDIDACRAYVKKLNGWSK